MVTSPTQRGVVVIGGQSKKLRKFSDIEYDMLYSDDSDDEESLKSDDFWQTYNDKHIDNGTTFIELSGNSLEELKWTIMPQKMQVLRIGGGGKESWNFHITIPMTYEACKNIEKVIKICENCSEKWILDEDDKNKFTEGKKFVKCPDYNCK